MTSQDLCLPKSDTSDTESIHIPWVCHSFILYTIHCTLWTALYMLHTYPCTLLTGHFMIDFWMSLLNDTFRRQFWDNFLMPLRDLIFTCNFWTLHCSLLTANYSLDTTCLTFRRHFFMPLLGLTFTWNFWTSHCSLYTTHCTLHAGPLDVPFRQHFWMSLCTSLLDVTFGCPFWKLLLYVPFGHHFKNSFWDVTFGHHFFRFHIIGRPFWT